MDIRINHCDFPYESASTLECQFRLCKSATNLAEYDIHGNRRSFPTGHDPDTWQEAIAPSQDSQVLPEKAPGYAQAA